MATLYLDRRDLSLKLEGQALAIYASGAREGTVPLHLLERIVLRSSVRLDSGALARLADSGIALAAFGGRMGGKLAIIHGRSHNDGARRIGQYCRYDDAHWRRRWARYLVLAKLRRQRRLLRGALAQRPDQRYRLTTALAGLDKAIARVLAEQRIGVDSLRGIEGAAAAAYFKGFCELFPPSLDFTGRNRQPPRDPVNAVLSLGYTLLHVEAVRAAYGAGLDPIIGYYHSLDYGRDSLASDLIEPLRPRVDAWAWEQFRERHLRAEHFRRDGDACLLGKQGRAHFYAAFEPAMRPIRRLLRRCTGKLAASLAEVGRRRADDANPTAGELPSTEATNT